VLFGVLCGGEWVKEYRFRLTRQIPNPNLACTAQACENHGKELQTDIA
jgi:hypothetical protein